MPTNWTQREVRAIVEDYFNMLESELRGQSFNKTEQAESEARLSESGIWHSALVAQARSAVEERTRKR